MYGGYDVYKVYLAVKLHFTTDTYDYYKYDGKVNATLESFTKRKDKYFFHKLSTRYGKEEILDFFVSNFCYDSQKWVGNLLQNDGKDIYLDYRKRKEAFIYHFRNDCNNLNNDFRNRNISFDDGFLCNNGQHPRALQLLIQRKISFQTAIVLDYFLSFIKDWDLAIQEKVVWKDISKRLKKLRSFLSFNATECKLVLKDIFVNE